MFRANQNNFRSILVLILCLASSASAGTVNLILSTPNDVTDVPVGTVITVQFSLNQDIKNIENIDFTASGTNTATNGGWLVGW